MRRRDLMLALTGLTSWPQVVGAQQKATWRIGVLNSASPGPNASIMAALRQGLAEAGYVDGQNLAIEYRWAEGRYDQLPAMASELIALNVDLIVTSGPNGIASAKAATSAIPIIFFGGGDLVEAGLIGSYAQPGGNLTGMGIFERELNPKRLEIMAELIPTPALLGVLMNMKQSGAEDIVVDMEDAARANRRRISIQTASTGEAIERAFRSLKQDGAAGLVVMADPFFNSRRDSITRLAAQYTIPAIYEWREFVDVGGLISYGPSLTSCWRQVGTYAARVLAGARPGDLPVLRPTQLELVVNLSAARALGLTIPPAILGRADDVID